MQGWMYQEEKSGPHLTASLLTLGLPTQIASQTGTSPAHRYSDSMREKKREVHRKSAKRRKGQFYTTCLHEHWWNGARVSEVY